MFPRAGLDRRWLLQQVRAERPAQSELRQEAFAMTQLAEALQYRPKVVEG